MGKGPDDIRINPLFIQRTTPQSNADQNRSSALRIRANPWLCRHSGELRAWIDEPVVAEYCLVDSTR